MRKMILIITGFLLLAVSIGVSLIGVNDFTTRLHIDRGNILADNMKYDQALTEFNKAIIYNLVAVETFAAMATAFANQGNWDSAIDYVDKGLALDPNNYFLNSFKSRYYLRINQLEEALNYCNKAISVGPNFEQALEISVLINFEKGNYYQVLMVCDKLIVLYPEDTVSRTIRGLVYVKSGIIDKNEIYKAIEDFSKVIEINPLDAVGYYNRGLAHKYLGESNKAESDFAKVLTLTKDPEILEYLGEKTKYILPNIY
jgi:tetratricopeptide (TPR) repeat protein